MLFVCFFVLFFMLFVLFLCFFMLFCALFMLFFIFFCAFFMLFFYLCFFVICPFFGYITLQIHVVRLGSNLFPFANSIKLRKTIIIKLNINHIKHRMIELENFLDCRYG